MNIYKKIYDDVKDLSKDDILLYLQNNIESVKVDYKIRISKNKKMVEIKDIEAEILPDIIKSIVKISPKELIYLLVNKYLRDKKNKIVPKGIKLTNAIMGLDLAYCISEHNKSIFIDIKLGQRIFGQIEFEDDYIDICLRAPFKNKFIIPSADMSYLFRNSKLDEILKMIENE